MTNAIYTRRLGGPHLSLTFQSSGVAIQQISNAPQTITHFAYHEKGPHFPCFPSSPCCLSPADTEISHLLMSTPMSHEPSDADNDITHVLNSSNIITLARLAAISASNADKVSQHLAHRLDCLSRPFFSSGTILWEILCTCDAVLSGSSALCLLLPITPATWKLNDLDLYVPHRHMRLLTTWLQNLGYHVGKNKFEFRPLVSNWNPSICRRHYDSIPRLPENLTSDLERDSRSSKVVPI